VAEGPRLAELQQISQATGRMLGLDGLMPGGAVLPMKSAARSHSSRSPALSSLARRSQG